VALTNAVFPSGTNAAATLVYSTTTGGPFTNSWNFRIAYFGQVLLSIPFKEGAGTNVSDVVWGISGSFITNNPFWTNDTPSRALDDFAVRFAPARKAVLLDSNRFISLGPDSSGTEGDYTLQAWVKLPTGFEPTARMIVFSYEGSPGIVLSINTGRTLHTTTFGLNDVNSTVTVVPNDNEWHHVAVVHVNGIGMRFYLDGVLGEEVAYVRGPGSRVNFTVGIGGAAGNLNNPFTGTMDRLRMTKGALAPNQFDYPIGVGLSAVRSGNTLTLSWPTSGGNLVPQSADVLLSVGTVWTDVPGTPTVTGSTVSLDTTVAAGPKFYRLRPGP
jgi:hypothetical protein